MVESIFEPIGKFRGREHTLAPDVDNVKHLLVPHGANLHTRIACRTRPRGLFTERKVEQRPGAFLSRGKVWKNAVQFKAFIDQYRGRTESLAGVGRRAHILAAVAHDA